MKIGIVGAGLVGSTAAYAMVMRGVGRQIVLVDRNEERARAEADDLLHAVPFANPLDVLAGSYAQLEGARVVVLTAGVGQRPGETRLELLARNEAVFGEVVPAVLDAAPEAVLVVATNPVDVMTHVAARLAAARGVPGSRVLGSGTTLDTARFRALLGRRLGVDAAHVHAYVVGEHGDSEVLTWSLVSVGGIPLEDMAERHGVPFDEAVRQGIDERVRRAAYTIIAGKGATYYGVGSAIARIVDAILRDQRSVLTVCSPMARVAGVADVTVSLPQIVGGAGVLEALPLALPADEERALARSAAVVRAAIDGLGTGRS
jgi:L-lactate dehydrogenase